MLLFVKRKRKRYCFREDNALPVYKDPLNRTCWISVCICFGTYIRHTSLRHVLVILFMYVCMYACIHLLL